MYKILIHIDTQSGDKWFYYQENGKDYVTDSLQEIKDTVLTLIDVYGEDYIKIVKQMSGQDMDNADVYLYNSTDNYEELDNRPSINGIEIIGQLSLEELGIQPAGNYTTEEQVQEMIADIEIPEVDFSGYATEEYVNEAIKVIDDNTIMVWLEKTNYSQVDTQIAIMQQVLPLLTSKNIIIQLYEKPVEQASYVDMVYRTYYWRPLIIEDINTYTGTLYWYGNAFTGIHVVNDTAYNSKVQPHLWIKVENGIITDISGLGGGSAQYQTNTEIDLLTKKYNKSWTPTQDYNPVHKKYVDDAIANIDIPETNLEGYATEEYVANAIEGYATTDYVDEKTKSFFIQAEMFDDFDTPATVEIFNQWIQDYRSTNNLKPFVIRTKNRNDGWKWYDFRCYSLTRQSEDKVTNPIYYISFITRRYDSNTVFYTLNMRLYTDQYQVTEVSCNMDNSYIQATTLSQPNLSNYLSKTNTTAYTPDKDYNPATKKYVDDAVANIDVPDVDLSDYYNKTEIDDKLLTVDVNVEGLDIYSDEERVIGRWVDGRPLYQRYIYIGELTNGITDTNLDDYGIKAYEVKFHQVYKTSPDGILCLISPQFMSMAGQVIARVLLYQESGFNVLRVAAGEGMILEGHTAYAIVTYTKPDDEILLPTSDYYPATQKYVNDAVASVSGGSGGEADLTNYYTKAEVDALLQELRNEFVSANNSINDKLETIIYGGE